MKERLSGSNMLYVSICLSGKFSQVENYLIFIRSAIDVIPDQINLVEAHKISLRSSGLECQLLEGVKYIYHTYSNHTNFRGRVYQWSCK